MKKVSGQRKDNELLQEATTAQLALEKRCNIIPSEFNNAYLDKKAVGGEPDWWQEQDQDIEAQKKFIDSLEEVPF